MESNTTTIKAILEKNISYPTCPFKKMKLSAQFDAIAAEVNELFERIRETENELRKEDSSAVS